jgi:hypothetical protein
VEELSMSSLKTSCAPAPQKKIRFQFSLTTVSDRMFFLFTITCIVMCVHGSMRRATTIPDLPPQAGLVGGAAAASRLAGRHACIHDPCGTLAVLVWKELIVLTACGQSRHPSLAS